MAQPADETPFWAAPAVVAAVVLAVAALKLWVSAATGLVLDEAYYTLWSYFPSFGYLDHPPAIAWQIATGRAIVGDNELGVRLIAVLSGAVAAVALYRIGRLLFSRRAAALGVIWYSLTTAAALGFLATPDSPSVLFWTLTLWAVAEITVGGRAAWWLAVGLFAGLGLASKLTNAFLPLGLAIFVLTAPARRRWLTRWPLWAGVVVGLAVFAPVLAWNADNGWATFLFQGQRVAGGNYSTEGFLRNVLDLVGGQMLAAGPILFVLAVVAIALTLGQRLRSTGLALLVLSSAPFILYLLIHVIRWKVEANWLVPVWPALSLAGASLVADWRPAGGARLFGPLVRWLQPTIGAVLIGLIFSQALWQPFDAPAIDRTREMRGWRDLQADLSALATQNGARWIAAQGGYGLPSELWTYGRFRGDPMPAVQLDQRGRYRFLPSLDVDAMGHPLLFVEELPGVDVPATAGPGPGSTLIGVVPRKSGDEVIAYYGAWLAP